MSRTPRVLSAAALLAVGVLSAACGRKPVEIRLKPARLSVYGLGRDEALLGVQRLRATLAEVLG